MVASYKLQQDTLGNQMNLLTDHHAVLQEIADDIHQSLVDAEQSKNQSGSNFYARAAARRLDEMDKLLEAHAFRVGRIRVELQQARLGIKLQ